MKSPIGIALLGSICIIYPIAVGHPCSNSKTSNFKETFSSDRLEGESSVHDARSKMECGSICFWHACKSFGIDLVTSKCYLYNFHVWFGGKIVEGGNLIYYWLYQGVCPESYNFDSIIKSCFKVKLNTLTWTEAMDACIEDGGLLAMLDSAAKYNTINGLNNQTDVFLGATDEREDELWKWLNGADILNWGSDKPTSSEVKNCMTFHPVSGLTDNMCNITLPYICEVPIF